MIFPYLLLLLSISDYFVQAINAISNPNKNPMKRIVSLYQQNPILALIVKSVAFFLYATTIVFIITILAVAFTG
jgi:hypothetical protein